MTERRNEDAIHRALVEWYTPVLARFGHVELVEKLVGPAATALVAEHLAAKGCLAVDSLNHTDLIDIFDAGLGVPPVGEVPAAVYYGAMRAALRRLAKGGTDGE